MARNGRNLPARSGTMKQTTLLGHILGDSPPTESPSTHGNSEPRTTTLAKRNSKRKRNATMTKSTAPTSTTDRELGGSESDVELIRFETQPIVQGSLSHQANDEEDEAPSPRRRTVKRHHVRSMRVEEHSETASVIELSDDDDEIPSPSHQRRGTAAPSTRRISESEDQESDASSRPHKRRLVRGMRPATPEGDADLDDELDEDKILETRLRPRDKRSTFVKNLQKLKRRKYHQQYSDSAEDSNDGESDNSSDGRQWRPIEGAQPPGSEAVDPNAEDEEDDFIVADDDETAPIVELPAAFSMNSHQDLAHHFKIVCQLFIHLSVQPLGNRHAFMQNIMGNNEYFSIPLQVVRRKLMGVRDSAVTSSVWRTSFKRPLETFPDLTITKLDFAVPSCDACHLGSRLSTRWAHVSGEPYDKLTFGPVSVETSDEDEASDETDEQERTPGFNLGRFCAKRTRVYHQFSHWEYHLYRELCAEIDTLRGGGRMRGFVRVAFPGGKQPPEDLSDADGICDWLDERGIISGQWKKIKDMLDSAQNLEVWAKDDDDQYS